MRAFYCHDFGVGSGVYGDEENKVFSGGRYQGIGNHQHGNISFSVRCLYGLWEKSVLVWTSHDSHLAADDLPDIHFHFRICLAVGDRGQSAAGLAF